MTYFAFNVEAIRPLLHEAKATDVLAAVDSYDRAREMYFRLAEAGNAAHELPRTLRSRHHDLVMADAMAGRAPDDAQLWSEVVAADVSLDRAKAVVAGCRDAQVKAQEAIQTALDASWPVVLPYLARSRGQYLTGGDPAGTGWAQLAQAMHWPKLDLRPAVDFRDVQPRYSKWWPLDTGAPDSLNYARPERRQWNEYCWGELAEERYDTVAADVIRLQRQWRPERYSRVSGSGQEAGLQPVVFLDVNGNAVANV